MKKRIKSALIMMFVLTICLSVLIPTISAATLYKNFTIPSGSNSLTNQGATKMSPETGTGRWAVGLNGNSNSNVSVASLYRINSDGSTTYLTSVYEISIGYQKYKGNIIFSSDYDYYTTINADGYGGVIGTISIAQ